MSAHGERLLKKQAGAGWEMNNYWVNDERDRFQTNLQSTQGTETLSMPSCLFHVSAGEVFAQLHLSVLSLIYKIVMGTVVTTGKVDYLFPSRQVSGTDSFGE